MQVRTNCQASGMMLMYWFTHCLPHSTRKGEFNHHLTKAETADRACGTRRRGLAVLWLAVTN